MNKTQTFKKTFPFTLIEIISVIVLIGIVGAIGGLSFSSVTQRYLIINQLEEVTQKLQFAHNRIHKELTFVEDTDGEAEVEVNSNQIFYTSKRDPSNDRRIFRSGNELILRVGANNYTLIDGVTGFTATQDSTTKEIIINISVAEGDVSVNKIQIVLP